MKELNISLSSLLLDALFKIELNNSDDLLRVLILSIELKSKIIEGYKILLAIISNVELIAVFDTILLEELIKFKHINFISFHFFVFFTNVIIALQSFSVLQSFK